MNKVFALLAAAGAGYIASIFTWERLRSWLVGAETELANLRASARALEHQLRD
jgi:hypothetical protein